MHTQQIKTSQQTKQEQIKTRTNMLKSISWKLKL